MVRLALLFVLFTSAALAHDAPSGWSYPLACCGGNDCGPIAASRVKPEGAGGYVVDAKFHVERKDVLESPDGLYHACFPTRERMSCFYAPPPGS